MTSCHATMAQYVVLLIQPIFGLSVRVPSGIRAQLCSVTTYWVFISNFKRATKFVQLLFVIVLLHLYVNLLYRLVSIVVCSTLPFRTPLFRPVILRFVIGTCLDFTSVMLAARLATRFTTRPLCLFYIHCVSDRFFFLFYYVLRVRCARSIMVCCASVFRHGDNALKSPSQHLQNVITFCYRRPVLHVREQLHLFQQ